MSYLYYSRHQSIELLQYYFFVHETYFLLLEKNTSENILIKEFLESLDNHRYWQLRKVEDYLVTLRDYVFWQSREIYLESMEKFVARKLNGSEFVNAVYFTLLSDKSESRVLEKDFEKQKTLELNPEIFQFSKVISKFEVVLSIFDEEPEPGDITEDELREIVKEHLPKVRKY
jgi:hypothetical protein